MTVTPEMIERAARAIDPNAFEMFDRLKGQCSEALMLRLKAARRLAQAALSAALGDTHVVVPREVLEPFGYIVGEGDEDYADAEPVSLRFGRTTAYLNLGELRCLHAVATCAIFAQVGQPTPAEKGGEG